MKKIIGVLLTSLSLVTLSSCNKTNEANTSTTNTTTTDSISSYQEYDNPFNMIGIGGFGYAGSFEILGPIEGSDVGEDLIITVENATSLVGNATGKLKLTIDGFGAVEADVINILNVIICCYIGCSDYASASCRCPCNCISGSA